MAVAAAGLELVAEGGLLHDDIHHDRQQDRQQNAGVDLRAGEQLVQPQLRRCHAVKRCLVDIAGLGVLHHVLEVADVEHPCHQIGGDPVGHNARQHLVDVQQSLQQAGDRAPQSAGQHTAQQSQDPDDTRRHGSGGNTQSDAQGSQRTHQILTRRTNVEQARLKGDGHGKAGHDQRRGSEQHITDVLRVKAPGQCTGSVTTGTEDTTENQANTVPDAAACDLWLDQANNEHHDAAHQQTDQNRDQGGHQLVEAIAAAQSLQFQLHACSPSFPMRLAPAI